MLAIFNGPLQTLFLGLSGLDQIVLPLGSLSLSHAPHSLRVLGLLLRLHLLALDLKRPFLIELLFAFVGDALLEKNLLLSLLLLLLTQQESLLHLLCFAHRLLSSLLPLEFSGLFELLAFLLCPHGAIHELISLLLDLELLGLFCPSD